MKWLNRKMLLSIIFLGLLYVRIDGKYICTFNQTIALQADTVYFIESPDFPRAMTHDEKDRCSFNFTKELSTGERNKRFIFAITNSYPYFCSSCDKNFTVYPYQPFYHFKFDDKHSAFQGYALFEDWNDDCYFESVSRVDPFNFTDETQIINLKYGIGEVRSKSHPCLWQFKAPTGYGFKIVVNEFSKDRVTDFSISNNEYAIANEKDVKINFPYYSYNNYLKVNLYEEPQIIEFSAYITIFKLQFPVTDANCSTSGILDKWTNIQNNTGYSNNTKCSYKRTIKPNTETRVTIEIMNVEPFVDHVYFYFNGYDSVPIDISGEEFDYKLSLYPYSDNTERTVLWEFISDGSLQSLGFSLIFEDITCSCEEPLIIVPCEAKHSFTLMNETDGYYCGNLKCNFTISLDPRCNKSEIIKMEISVMPEKNDIFDVFRIITDNITVLEINHSNHYYSHTMFLYSNSSNIFQAITASNLYVKTMLINLNVYGPPTDVTTIMLTTDKPYYAYHLCENNPPNIFNIELSHELVSQNALIEMYSTLINIESSILFFNNESITHKINFDNCFSDNAKKFSCKTLRTKFSVFHYNHEYTCVYPIYLLFQSTTHAAGCVFSNNIYDMQTAYEKFPVIISVMSNSISTCKIFVFPFPLIEHVNSIWTTPKVNGFVKIYAGSENKQFAFIDTSSTSSWRNIQLNSHIYVLEIPVNAAIAIYVDFQDNPEIAQYPYNTIFTSPHYGEPKTVLRHQNYTNKPYMTYKIRDCDVKFTLTVYKLDSRLQYYIKAGKERINITADFGTKIFTKTNVGIYYECLLNTSCYGNQAVAFQIETLEKRLTITPLQISTTISTTALTQTEASNTAKLFSLYNIWFIFTLYVKFQTSVT